MKFFIRNSVFAVAGFLGLWLYAMAAGSPVLVKEKSKIEFIGSKAGGSHKGGFKTFSVEGNIEWGNFSKSNLKIDIDATSLWSDDGGLTGHLKNRDFFNVKSYPKIQFEATSIGIGNDGAAIVRGKLTMLDQVVDMFIPCKIAPTDTGITVSAKLTIDRTKWGMTYGQGRVDNEVDISATLVFRNSP